MLSITDKRGLYREPLGFAQAKTEVLALRDAIIPAFAIETVCCSITWKIEVQSNVAVNFHRTYKKIKEWLNTECISSPEFKTWAPRTFQITSFSQKKKKKNKATYLCRQPNTLNYTKLERNLKQLLAHTNFSS